MYFLSLQCLVLEIKFYLITYELTIRFLHLKSIHHCNDVMHTSINDKAKLRE